jgi:hypothetical protein
MIINEKKKKLKIKSVVYLFEANLINFVEHFVFSFHHQLLDELFHDIYLYDQSKFKIIYFHKK